jgi:dipeptidyl aminopeptidase/acylaminoacyl peptidase
MPDAPGFLSVEPFVAHSHEVLVAAGVYPPERTPTPQMYAFSVKALQQQVYANVYRVFYRSGGYRFTGILVTPVEVKNGSHPIILFNRGGYRAFGMNTAGSILRHLLPLARRNNALVFASQYRQADGSEGQDEYCGAEIEDVLSLLAIARAHPSWDGKHSLMVGWSRGTAMTYGAIKRGAQIGAAVCVAGIADFWAMETHRPVFREKVFPQTMPDFEHRREAHYFERSAIRWPQLLCVPLFLMHGDKDERAEIAETLRLADELAARKLPHQLVVYPGDDHGLNYNFEDAMARMGEWMRSHPE